MRFGKAIARSTVASTPGRTSAVARPATLRTWSRYSSPGFAVSFAAACSVSTATWFFFANPWAGARPFPRGVLRHLERRPPDGLLTIGLARGQVPAQHEPPRSPEDNGAFRVEELATCGLEEAGLQLLAQPRQPRRRHLLEADLDEQLSHDAPLRPAPRPRRRPPRRQPRPQEPEPPRRPWPPRRKACGS